MSAIVTLKVSLHSKTSFRNAEILTEAEKSLTGVMDATCCSSAVILSVLPAGTSKASSWGKLGFYR